MPSKNPLTYLPAKYRGVAYSLLGVAALGLGAYEAADGDWLKAAGLLLGSLGFGTARSNIHPDD